MSNDKPIEMTVQAVTAMNETLHRNRVVGATLANSFEDRIAIQRVHLANYIRQVRTLLGNDDTAFAYLEMILGGWRRDLKPGAIAVQIFAITRYEP